MLSVIDVLFGVVINYMRRVDFVKVFLRIHVNG